MEESEDNMSAEDMRLEDGFVKAKPKKRSLVERELETNLTARVTSPILNRDATSTSRYGRARRLKTEADFSDTEKAVLKCLISSKRDVAISPSKIQPPAYKMHASNSPIQVETPKKPESALGNQIESIYNENISLSRFGSEEKKSVAKKFPKVYIRKDLIQTKEKEIDDTVVLIKNIFSPNKSITKSKSSFDFESSAEKNYSNKSNGYLNTLSVVKTLDFDGNKKKKTDEKKSTLSKSELFELEAKSEYQVGDLAWARMGTYPFWPCIITRDPLSGMFVKKKLFGRIERDVMHVTFFGDNGRRGWIVGSMLRKFLGQLEFETTKMNFTPKAKKKDHRLYAAFFISEKKTPLWQIAVQEAESLLREPKRLRIDILGDMIKKSRNLKSTPKIERGRKVTRTNSDVSLSESLYDTLFSEDDSKVNETERSRSKSRNRSLDVSEVVTACLDNMAAKTGITKLQRQSHMDRWLQKAKSKTPEKSHYKSQSKESSSKSKKKSKNTRSSRRSESFSKLHNDHDYSQKYSSRNSPIILDEVEIEYNNAEVFDIEPGSGIGIISKVETLCGKNQNEMLDNVIFQNASIEVNSEESSEKSKLTENVNDNEAQLVFKEAVNDLGSAITNEINKTTPSIYTKIPDIIDNNILDNIFATDDSSSDIDTNNEDIGLRNDQITTKNSNFNNLSDITVNKDNHVDNMHNNQEVNTDVQEINENTEKSTINEVKEIDSMQLEINTDSVESNDLVSNSCITANNFNTLNEETNDTKVQNISNEVDSINETNDTEVQDISNEEDSINETHDTEVHDISNEVDSINETHDTKVQDISNKVDPVNENETHETKVQDISNKVDPVNENNTHDTKVQDISNKVDPVNENKTHDTKVQDISNKVDPVNENETHETKVQDISNIVDPVNENKTHDTKVQDISNKVDPVNENETHETKVQDISNKVDPVNENETHETKVQDISNKVDPVNENNTHDTKVQDISNKVDPVNENKTHDTKVQDISNKVDPVNENETHETKVQDISNKVDPVNENKTHDTKVQDISSKVDHVNENETHETKVQDISNTVNVNENTITENNLTLEQESEISEILENIVEKVKIYSPTDNKKSIKNRYKLSLKKSNKTKNIDRNNKNIININKPVTYNQIENGHIDNNLNECVDLEMPVCKIINKSDKTNYDKDAVITEPLPLNKNDVQEVCTENKIKTIEDTTEDYNNLTTDQINQISIEIESDTQKTKTDDKNSCNTKLDIEMISKTNEEDCVSIGTSSDLNELNQDVQFDDEINKEITNDVLNEINQETSVNQNDEANKQVNVEDNLKLIDENQELIQIEKEQKDDDNMSVKSEGSEVSLSKRKRVKEKSVVEKKNVLEDPEFLKYLELRQDAVMDDHPELSQEDITNYLYKTWLYEENLKSDIKKTDDIDQTNLVKGLNLDPAPVKKARKKVKVEKEIEEVTVKEKSKRKIIRPFYKEDFSDGDDSIEYFDIFKTKKDLKGGLIPDNKPDTLESEGTVLERIINVDEYMQDEYDDVEEYFRQLTVPKANVFKGYIREKVCEVCEKVGNLVKCKGCHSMFHIECDKKEVEIIECPTPTRGRKKKRKNRGRKPKDDLGQDSGSDEKSQDANVSEELNMSIEEESHIIANADEFEALLSANMQEILKDQSIKYDFYSREKLDWNDTHIGECKIVDIKPRMDSIELSDFSEFKCKNCKKFDPPTCFVCKYPISPKDKQADRQKCQVAHCNKYYHLECLDHWPQTQFTHSSQVSRTNKFCEALSCPRHVCHTCVCDDPRGCKTRFSGDKLARCVRCPATYHTFTKCLPAGTQILTASHIICPRHYEHRPGKVPCHVNTGWCFICALGGSLICCEYCPTSFHAECLNIKPPEGGYMCEDCETGRLPLYGEMVWVKLGHYRWWPGIILHPTEIPDNILAVKHTLGEFVVRFFGQYDYYWVNRGRVFPFQEGDSGKVSTQRSKIDAAFSMAMEHAQRACEILKSATPNEEESSDIASSLLPPHYVKLKVNKPCGSLCGKKIDLEESSLTQCECDPNDVDPCGPYTQCLNRMLLTECGPTCRAADRCNNRAFEKRLYPRLEPYRTPHRGWGLRAAEDIRAGRFVIEYVGELLDEDEFRRRMSLKHEVRDENFYFLTLDKERMIDAGPKGNLARFMNHSCEPNCETQKWTVLGDVRVGLFAICDIPANTELTFNYNLETSGIEKKRCMCGAKRCSGYIGAKPKQEEQPKKLKTHVKRTYKKRKAESYIDSPSTSQYKKRGRPLKPRELTDIEKDLLIIKNATNGLSSDSEGSRLSMDSWKDSKALKRKRINLSTDEMSPKRAKSDEINMLY